MLPMVVICETVCTISCTRWCNRRRETYLSMTFRVPRLNTNLLSCTYSPFHKQNNGRNERIFSFRCGDLHFLIPLFLGFLGMSVNCRGDDSWRIKRGCRTCSSKSRYIFFFFFFICKIATLRNACKRTKHFKKVYYSSYDIAWLVPILFTNDEAISGFMDFCNSLMNFVWPFIV